ncbi:iron uptake system protein EfeO [Actinokineospora globicatena]|uniref:iron uptake system protein EfeO n=1 Tax=Actinokineospora globicatena TaxID=103729 RepID=UPI0020A55784|nr:iron uptake system protein EfeO [Actinokineospora globicatena]MCP2306325.1 iron uptake system component EfeO [Actinokineospora globicatena]GLW81751.1 lipoprotein [Actinokineospora globicatena]GLW88546.1 lipoprotein [Actinokineospora globicatena]
MRFKDIGACLTGLAVLLPLVACSSDNGGTAAAPGGPIAVEAKDDACGVARVDSDAGTITFEVTNKGSRVTEFYLYGEGDRIMGEVENITPGLTRRLIVEVPDGGKYQTSCRPGMSGEGIRAEFTVKGSATRQVDTNTKLAEATKNYQNYINAQVEPLVTKTTEFVAAIKAADVAMAKGLFPVARTYWERIEPVAESFGDLDPKIDAREADLEPGQEFTGFHRLEKDLWVSGPQSDTVAIAERLLTDVTEIATRAKAVELTPLQLANGAKELLDEVATGKITGEEDIFSHTDLWDFRANVEGSAAAVSALRPVIVERDPELAKTLETRFDAVTALLDKHRSGDGYQLYSELSESDIKDFAAAVDALGEPISKVAEVVAQK